MIEALNIIEGFDGRPAFDSADYIHRTVEALKLAYADRDTYYGDPKFNHWNLQALLTKEYAASRRKQIGERASLEFRPGPIDGKIGQHAALADMASYKVDDVLKAHDTTCVDTMDSEGIVFSATPSGAWMPSVIAGDTGIPLTQRAQSFVLVPGNPNELAGGKRPRVTLSPTLVMHPDGKPFLALSTPGGDDQEQALLQLMLNVDRLRDERAERHRSAALHDRAPGGELRRSLLEAGEPETGRAHSAVGGGGPGGARAQSGDHVAL